MTLKPWGSRQARCFEKSSRPWRTHNSTAGWPLGKRRLLSFARASRPHPYRTIRPCELPEKESPVLGDGTRWYATILGVSEVHSMSRRTYNPNLLLRISYLLSVGYGNSRRGLNFVAIF